MKTSLSMKHGTEGPRFDPYSFDERIVEHNGQEVVLHSGLMTWLLLNGDKVVDNDEQKAAEQFEVLTGLSIRLFDRYYNRIRNRCKCGCRHTEYKAGMPGETLVVCVACGDVLDCDFNESAII